MIPVEAQANEKIDELAERMAKRANHSGQIVFALFNDKEIVARPGDSSIEVRWSYGDQFPRNPEAVYQGFHRPYTQRVVKRLNEVCLEGAFTPELVQLALMISGSLMNEMFVEPEEVEEPEEEA